MPETMIEANTKPKSKIYSCLGLILLLILISIYGVNYFQLQTQMNQILNSDPRNKGIDVSVHYKNYINISTLVYDLKSVSDNNSMADVFRVFMHYANKIENKKFDKVELSFRGNTKFIVKGDYYNRMGKEFPQQNPIYIIRTFPENLYRIDGSNAYPKWSGGLIGVVSKQMEDFNNVHKLWYIDDLKK
jgi:hypothetical protein